ncbi:hypothetical protein [Hyalangium versicolor]|uniref:hypothetical protein n=1 Tax=Hyalangium versicolor TaxID=2861190 RepID=UPI001CCC9B80|nr:hypothetical protein [Hyalangium versicolor]
MERVRSPHSADEAFLETLEPLPGTSSLSVLVSTVRSPGVTRNDVDALLQRLARPLADGESPRARADVLLSLLESSDVGELQGSEKGLTVHAAAVQALLELGYPYALEIPPEALTGPLGFHGALQGLKLPIPGTIAMLAGFTAQAVELLPWVFQAVDTRGSLMDWFFLAMFLGPTAMTLAGGLSRLRGLLMSGLVSMGLVGGFWLYVCTDELIRKPFMLDYPHPHILWVAGLGFLLSSILLRPSAWLDKDAPAQAEEPPPTPRAL